MLDDLTRTAFSPIIERPIAPRGFTTHTLINFPAVKFTQHLLTPCGLEKVLGLVLDESPV